ncbi:MAG TPA: hypothetical protein DCR39_05925 [Nitrospiraceae bacterium]|nr:hypothetical protein [Nitrospiraceae bacterium]
MKRFLGVVLVGIMLAGCTIKTADYTINQGVPSDCTSQVVGRYGTSPGQSGAGSTNSGGSGNTVIIIEDSKQDSQGSVDPSSLMQTAVDKIKDSLPDIGSLVPSATTTNPPLAPAPGTVHPGETIPGQGELEVLE